MTRVAAAAAGLETGDVIRVLTASMGPTGNGVGATQLNANQTVPMTVERAGKTVHLSLPVPASAKSDTFDLSDEGISPQFLPGPISVTKVQPGTPAEQSGLRAGDQIESVDGHSFHFVNTLLAYMQWEKGKPMTLDVLRNGATVQMVATPAKLDPSGWKLGFAPVPIPIRDEPLSVTAAFASRQGSSKAIRSS